MELLFYFEQINKRALEPGAWIILYSFYAASATKRCISHNNFDPGTSL